jgi:hypothetical protein
MDGAWAGRGGLRNYFTTHIVTCELVFRSYQRVFD